MDFENNKIPNFVDQHLRQINAAIRDQAECLVPVGDYDYRSYALKFNGGSRRRVNPAHR
jgi:hypothetical protein